MTTAVAIIDANALIDLKHIRVGIQWRVLRVLEDLVESGAICVPGHVIIEVARPPHPDAPGAWAKGIEKKQAYEWEADPEYVLQVMGGDLEIQSSIFQPRVGGVPELLDQNADTEQADPYVVAMALQLKAEGHECVVVTRDKKNRPDKMSPVAACRKLGIPTTTIEDYLESMRDHFDDRLATKAAADIRRKKKT